MSVKTTERGSGSSVDSARRLFSDELRRYRRARGFTQEQLGNLINYAGATVGMIEKLQRNPTLAFTERCDRVLETGGALSRLLPLSREAYPSWFRPFVEMEAATTDARWYVRDSKDPQGGLLAVAPEAWRAFVCSVRRRCDLGELGLAEEHP